MMLVLHGADAHQEDAREAHTLLQRKRITPEGMVLDDTYESSELVFNQDTDTDQHHLAGLWNQAASQAEKDMLAYRLLQDASMSMTMAPTTSQPATATPTTPNPTFLPTSTMDPTAPTASPSASPSLSQLPTTFTQRPTSSQAPSSAPTESCLEGRTVEEYFLEVLTPITPATVLLDPTTPQGMAFEYMVNEDPYLLANPCRPTLDQRYGLTTLFFATTGASWTNNDGWLGDSQECNWFGVLCDDSSMPLRVTELVLENNNLDGSLPSEISVLYLLVSLNLFANSLVEELPSGLDNLTVVETLDFTENLLSGPAFPQSLLGLTDLRVYRVGANQLDGNVPSEIGNLQSLEELIASNNDLTGSLPSEIGNLNSLSSLSLNDNDLFGTLPTELGLLPLESLRVNGNRFQGIIPSALFNVGSLTSLRLNGNFLFGEVAPTIGQLTNLIDLRLDVNNLSGSIPSEIVSLVNLRRLSLNDNFWSGTIPDVFGNYVALDILDVSNSFSLSPGSVPMSVFSVPTLRLAYLSNCQLTGTFPSNFATPPLLRDLYLDGNSLQGQISPIQQGQLLALSDFRVQNNDLTGSMPASICNLRLSGILDDLFADCAGATPEIECDFPDCCTMCF